MKPARSIGSDLNLQRHYLLPACLEFHGIFLCQQIALEKAARQREGDGAAAGSSLWLSGSPRQYPVRKCIPARSKSFILISTNLYRWPAFDA